MPAIANESRLVSNGLEVDLFPRTAHLRKLLWIREDSIQRLSDLVNVEESHWQRSTVKSETGSNAHNLQTRWPKRAPNSTLGSTNVFP